jgi:ectoine hydroxylase-related dioxygenase (phytanoyl-CoA dioxygenase family)
MPDTADQSAGFAAMELALRELGVHGGSLDAASKAELDRRGYLVIPGFLDPAWLERMRDAYEGVVAKEGVLVGLDHHQERGARRLGNLVNKGEAWDSLYVDARLLAAARHILARPFKLGALSGRDPLLGGGSQGFHCDTAPRRAVEEPFTAVSACIMLDDSTVANGATRLIPGSHLRLGEPREVLKDSAAIQPDEIQLEARAGTALVFNAHLWHAGAVNRDGSVRRMVHAYYQGREQKPWLDQAEFIRKRTWDRIGPAARWLLDV